MNNIISSFDQILDFGKSYGSPLSKKKGILREYLQSKIIDIFYREKISVNLFFIGGTSLRLLRNLDRFSEDLDFDTINISPKEIDSLIKLAYQKLTGENLEIDIYKNTTSKRKYFEFRFQNLLYSLRLSKNKEEKLKIKFDFEKYWQGQTKEIILLNKYGFTVNTTTINLEQVLVQKIFAYLHRKETLARDIYDIVWLLAHQVKPDLIFLKKNKLSSQILIEAGKKFEREKTKLRYIKLKLRPFLLSEDYLNKLDFFPDLMEKLISGNY